MEAEGESSGSAFDAVHGKTGNLNATAIAIAEKAANMIRGHPPLAPEDPRP